MHTCRKIVRQYILLCFLEDLVWGSKLSDIGTRAAEKTEWPSFSYFRANEGLSGLMQILGKYLLGDFSFLP